MNIHSRFFLSGFLIACLAHAQGRQEPGHSIGKISTQGDLIVMTLDDGALGRANMFDLVRHTLRFTPDGSRYRAENLTWQWDSEFGPEMAACQHPVLVALQGVDLAVVGDVAVGMGERPARERVGGEA